jgi:putative FmdB family regulatory protein
MPIYEYACSACEHEFEQIQKFSDPSVCDCPKCHKKNSVQRKLSTSAFHLSGGGWYSDGYGKGGSAKSEAKAESSSGGGKSEAKAESSGGGGKSEAKAESSGGGAKSEGKAESSGGGESKPSGSKAVSDSRHGASGYAA